MPRSWTRGAAWKGAGASVLLHLLAAAAVIVALSGPPRTSPRVIDLTLLPPAETGRRPDPVAVVAAAEPAGASRTAVPQEPSALPDPPIAANPPAPTAPSAAANPPDGTGQAHPSPPGPIRTASAPGSSDGRIAAPASTGKGTANAAAGVPPGTAGAGTTGAGPAGNYSWIRDAIQHAVAYPMTARRMGWEGKVVVGFQLLSDGSVRDVRIVQGSGHAALDRGAIDAVRNASPFPRSPVEAEVITPVVYRLTTP